MKSDSTRIPCKHCGTPFLARKAEDEFCCNGCAYVFRLIKNEGFEDYYKLRDKQIQPVKQANLHPKDYQWLKAAAAPLENSSSPEITLDLEGISCVGCVWLIEKLFHEFEGSKSIELNAQLGQVRLRWKAGEFDLVGFAKEVQRFGYLLGPAGERKSLESKRLVSRVGLCAAFALNTMLFTLPSYLGMEQTFFLADLFTLLSLAFATLSFLVGGSYFIKRATRSLQLGIVHIDLPIAIGIMGAYLGSLAGWLLNKADFLYFDFVSVFVFLMLCGRWVQERAVEKNRNRLLEANRFNQQFQVVDDQLQNQEKLNCEGIKPGIRLSIAPGEVVPVLSQCEQQSASLSLEWINGESETRLFPAGHLIPAGAQNVGIEPILVQTEEDWANSLLKKLLANSSEDRRNLLVERILKHYLSIILLIALGTLGYWGLLTKNWGSAFQAALSVLIVSCPCALGVAIPLAEEWAWGRLRKSGLFVQTHNLFPRLSKIKTFLFDKTGTLTLESPVLTNPSQLKQLDPKAREVLRRMSRMSLHPISRALRDALLELPEEDLDLEEGQLTEEVGFGLSWKMGDQEWSLGKPGWKSEDSEAQCTFALNGKLLAEFHFEEKVRDNAKECLDQLKQDYQLMILSGDKAKKVEQIAAELGLKSDQNQAELNPEEKADWVRKFGPESVFFLGDGANDSLAFEAAAVRGTPATPNGLLQNKTDFYFTGQDLSSILELLRIADHRNRLIRHLFLFAITYNIIALSLAVSGHMHPLLAAILMPLSSLATLGLIARTAYVEKATAN